MSCRLTLVDIKRCWNVTITQRWPQRQNLWKRWSMSQNLQLLTSGSHQPPLVSIGSKSDNTLTSAEDFLQVQRGSFESMSTFMSVEETTNTSAVGVHRSRCSEEPNHKCRTSVMSQPSHGSNQSFQQPPGSPDLPGGSVFVLYDN